MAAEDVAARVQRYGHCHKQCTDVAFTKLLLMKTTVYCIAQIHCNHYRSMIHLWVVVYKPGETMWGEVDASHQNLCDPKLIYYMCYVLSCGMPIYIIAGAIVTVNSAEMNTRKEHATSWYLECAEKEIWDDDVHECNFPVLLYHKWPGTLVCIRYLFVSSHQPCRAVSARTKTY